MSERMESESQGSKLVDLIAGEVARTMHVPEGSLVPNPGALPCALGDYVEACHELTNREKGLLPDELLEQQLLRIRENSKLKDNFPPGYTCCIALLPFSLYGNPFSKEEIARGDHLSTLFINPAGVTLRGFATHNSYIADLLPPEVRSLAFKIAPYDNPGPYTITKNDYERLAAQYEKAFRKLQALL